MVMSAYPAQRWPDAYYESDPYRNEPMMGGRSAGSRQYYRGQDKGQAQRWGHGMVDGGPSGSYGTRGYRDSQYGPVHENGYREKHPLTSHMGYRSDEDGRMRRDWSRFAEPPGPHPYGPPSGIHPLQSSRGDHLSPHPHDYLSSAPPHYPEHGYRSRDMPSRIGPGPEYDKRMSVNYATGNQYDGLYGTDRQRYSRRNDHRKTILPTPVDDRMISSYPVRGGGRSSPTIGRNFDSSYPSPSSSWSPSDGGSPRYGKTGSQEDMHLSPHDNQRRVPPSNHIEFRDRDGGMLYAHDGVAERGGSVRMEDKKGSVKHPLEREQGRASPDWVSGRTEPPLVRRTPGTDRIPERTEVRRDPRLYRKGEEEHCLQAPVAMSFVQIMDEHAYCQRKTLWSSDVEPQMSSPEKIPVSNSDVTPSCFLSVASRGRQRKPLVANGSSTTQQPPVNAQKPNREEPSKKPSSLVPAETTKVSVAVSPDAKKETESPACSTPEKADTSESVNAAPPSLGGRPVTKVPSLSFDDNLNVYLDNFTLDLDTDSDSSEDEALGEEPCLVVSLPNSLVLRDGLAGLGSSHNPGQGSLADSHDKMDEDSLSSLASNPGSLKLRLKQYPSNQIRLRNGRVLPPSTLAIYASRKGQQGEPGDSSSPANCDENDGRELEGSDTESVGDKGDKDWENGHLESDESSFEIPDSACTTPDKSDNPGNWKQPTRRGKRRRRKTNFFQYGRKKKANISSQAPASVPDEDSSPLAKRTRSNYPDFVPVILPAKSRAESATLKRRSEMVKEIEEHELHQAQEAPPPDVPESPSIEGSENWHMEVGSGQDSSYCHMEVGSGHGSSYCHMDVGSGQGSSYRGDDTSSLNSISLTTSDSASRDADGSSVNTEFSPELIARCRRVQIDRSSGDTPLHKICRNGKFEMARCLIMVEHASVNSQDYAGWTPLHEACSNGHIDLVELLLENGADTNISAREGTRAIHDAIEIGSLELVKMLVEHGADPLAEIGDKTPVEYAMSLERWEIRKYLQDVVEKRQRSKAAMSKPSSHPKASTRQSQKQKLVKQAEIAEESEVAFPLDGYIMSDGHVFGEELDYPLFYVSPVIEMSTSPLLPVYNFQVSQGRNPRRHNFHLLDDILEAVNMSEEQFSAYLGPDIRALPMNGLDITRQLKHAYYNQQVSVPVRLKNMAKSAVLKFIPLCSRVRGLLGIQVSNLDD